VAGEELCSYLNVNHLTPDRGQLAFSQVATQTRCTFKDGEDVPQYLQVMCARLEEDN
jgi:hypothetical protein